MSSTMDLENLIDRLNPVCQTALEEAASFCVSNTHYNIEVEHVLIKLLEQGPDTDAHRLLRNFEVDPSTVVHELTEATQEFKRGNSRTPSMAPQVVQLLREAWLRASTQLDLDAVRSGVILLALLDDESLLGVATDAAPTLLDLPRERLDEIVAAHVRETDEGSSDQQPALSERTSSDHAASSDTPEGDQDALSQYAQDLTAQARNGDIDPIRGRDTEIRQVADILMRRRQNNPILTGEAGVGKTAVVEGFAQRVARGDVPAPLESVSVHQLDLGLLQAGASMRGEFEDRLRSVIDEVKAASHPLVLFIDEVHALIGAGAKEGQADAANLLKPALARGELRTIAATTSAEYKKYFEKDAALARRFQNVQVDEPDIEAAMDMLRGVAEKLQVHHDVFIREEALRDAVTLSDRYITGRNLPDKAITVLDTAGARVASGQSGVPPALEDARHQADQLQTEIERLEREAFAGAGEHADRIRELTDRLEEIQERQERLEAQWEREQDLVEDIRTLQRKLVSVPEAEAETDSPSPSTDPSVDPDADTLNGRNGQKPSDLPENADEIRDTLEEKRAALDEARNGGEALVPVTVDSHVITQVISGWTGIPEGKMQTDQVEGVLSLEERLRERVVGQDHALETIARRVHTSRAGLEDPNKPVGVFLLTGPSGVGKTETAQTLADELYGGHLIRINLSEYQEGHAVSKLKGAPPGYVGHGEGGVLTEAVRHSPYSVVLLDEIEKAHPEVRELFYQVFDKGELEDADGVTIDFRSTIIILTSNIGTGEIMSLCREGAVRPEAEVLGEAVREKLREQFRPAFLGRLVSVPYYPLREEDMEEIVQLKLDRVQDRFEANHNAALTYSDAVVDRISARCQEVESGARNIDTILTHTILPNLSAKLLGRMAEETTIQGARVEVGDDGQFTYHIEQA
jgi:type VI secretion system protein VasG